MSETAAESDAASEMTSERPGENLRRPERIQRKRTNGWRLPPDAVYVGRPSKWGNPWHVATGDGWTWIEKDGRAIAPSVRIKPGAQGAVQRREMASRCVDLFQHFAQIDITGLLLELAGRDLACWCPLDSPCHADVLLGIANA